ncbi:hypothetical protein FRC05_003058 [Tulasnella sp. 425]|nr:hypothetical protein FRC05_003058 [Tulasnella sp. 425]
MGLLRCDNEPLPFTEARSVLQRGITRVLGDDFSAPSEASPSPDVKNDESARRLLSDDVFLYPEVRRVAQEAAASGNPIVALFGEVPTNPLLRTSNMVELRKVADDLALNHQRRYHSIVRDRLEASYEDLYRDEDVVCMELNSRDSTSRIAMPRQSPTGLGLNQRPTPKKAKAQSSIQHQRKATLSFGPQSYPAMNLLLERFTIILAAKTYPHGKILDRDPNSGQEDHPVAGHEHNVDGNEAAPTKGKNSKGSGKKRTVSAATSDDTPQGLLGDDIPTKKKKLVPASGEVGNAIQPRRTRSQTASTGAGDRSDGMEARDHPDTVTKPLTSKTSGSASKLKRIESDSEDWDEKDIEVHYSDDETLNKRIKALIEWEDKNNNLYAPAKIPKAGVWAQIGSNQEWTWCTSASSKVPVLFCCVGRVTYHSFYAGGEPQREVTVSLRMVEPKDTQHLQKFLKRHTSDSTPEWDNVKFTRFQAKKADTEAKPFKRYYDARDAGSYGNEDAGGLSVREDLRNGDLVIVEATAIRFAAFNSPKKKWGSSPEKSDKRWVARFRLMVLWKLKDSEAPTSDDEDYAKPGPSRGKGKAKMI